MAPTAQPMALGPMAARVPTSPLVRAKARSKFTMPTPRATMEPASR
jgi:hypothetical protein